MTVQSPVIVALDYADQASAEAIADQLDPTRCRLKVGKELFTYCGPAVVESLQNKGFEIFLDLKFHDIPNTVAGAVKAAAELGVWMVNVHASGGERMMVAARDALGNYQKPPLLTAVTVLTSMTADDLQGIGITREPLDQVKHLAKLAKKSGMDGVVCSAQEVTELRSLIGDDFLLVTPGIRPADAALGDQRRVATPASAMEMGSTHLVVGRPITQHAQPLQSLAAINKELGIL
jgi:orotidine-5'-phosphate decarboxylase